LHVTTLSNEKIIRDS